MKPLVEVGDSGTPLMMPEEDGDLERSSEVRRSSPGVGPVYKSRVVIGECGCGNPVGERDSGPSPGEFMEPNRGLISGGPGIEK